MATTAAMEETASSAMLRYYRCSPQKAKLVVDQIRGRNVNAALALLRHSPKAASRAIGKLLKSAVANAEKGGSQRVDIDSLFVAEAWVGPGPSLTRSRGRAFGRAFPIKHRMCHIRLRLAAKMAQDEAVPVGRADAAEGGTAKAGGASAPKTRARTRAHKAAPAVRKPAGRKR